MATKDQSPVRKFKRQVRRLTDDKHDKKDYQKFKKRTTEDDQQKLFRRVTTLANKRERNNDDIKDTIPNLNKKKNDGKNKDGGKGKGKGDGKGKGKKKSPYYKEASKLVKHELQPQFQEIQRYIKMLQEQRQNSVGFEQRMGDRTQNDLSAIFGKAGEFNTDQQQKIAQVMGQAQQGISQTYGTTSQNIDAADAKANESASDTLNRLGITPVSGRLAEDQAWMQGLNEQNRASAAQGVAAQKGIFAGAGGMLGMAISGEGATQQGAASVATAEAIRRARETSNLEIGDVRREKSDLKKQRGAMINQAQSLLKQQAFEQMMEQAQLMALNKKTAAEMKLNWAQLNETAQYHQGQLQNDANELAFDKWKEQHDQWMDLHKPKDGSGGKLSGDLSGWKDARNFAFYKVGKKNPQTWNKLQPLFSSMQAGWGSHALDVNDPDDFSQMYQWSVNYINDKLKATGAEKRRLTAMVNDMLNIARGDY